MKAKYLAIGMVLIGVCLTGCTDTQIAEKTYVEGTNKAHMQYDLTEWGKLKDAINSLEEEQYQDEQYLESGRNDSISVFCASVTNTSRGNTNSVGEDGYYIEIGNIEGKYGQKAVALLEQYIGEEVHDVIEAMKNLPSSPNTEGKILQLGETNTVIKVIGEYGLVGYKTQYTQSLYIMHEPFKLAMEEDSAFINEFMSDNFMLKAFSEGEEASVIELFTPIYCVALDRSAMGSSSSYYQFFRDKQGEISKVRMVINTDKINDSNNYLGIYASDLEPLQKVLAFYGEESDMETQIKVTLEEILKGQSKGTKLKGTALNGVIKVQSGRYDGKLITIEVQK